MRTRVFAAACSFIAVLLVAAAPAFAQYGARLSSNTPSGETYHVEVAGELWDPTPNIVISSESLGIPGTNVDFVNTLGIQKTLFKQLKVVLRPGKKQKFRFEYTPMTYTANQTVNASFVFNGQHFTVGLPVTTTLQWKAYRFGYEYDFLYHPRWFVGFVGEVKYTDIQATLSTSFGGVADTEFTHAQAPIPAVGGIGRGYVTNYLSITGEFTFFKLPTQAANSNSYGGSYYDFDLYGTVNFTKYVGAQVGYRSFDVNYQVKQDTGTMTLKGPYFGGVVRF